MAQVGGSDSGKQAVDAGVAERRARAAEIRNEAEDALRAAAVRQEGDMLMHEGRYDEAQALYAESNAIFSGKQFVSPAVAERRARAVEIRNEAEDALRAAAVRQEGDMLMHEGRYDEAQALYAESNAIFSGKQFVSPAVAARRAQAAEIRQQGDQALHDGNWERAQQLYQESNAVFDGKSTK